MEVRPWDQYSVDGSVAIRASTIPDAGHGLFALRDFCRGEIVTFYHGKKITHEHALALPVLDASHVVALSHNFTALDGRYHADGRPIASPAEMHGLGGGAYANDAGSGKHNVKFVHVSSVQGVGRAFAYCGALGHEAIVLLKATRAIRKDDEIFVSYGTTYWTRRELNLN